MLKKCCGNGENDFHVSVTPPEVLGLKYFLLGVVSSALSILML